MWSERLVLGQTVFLKHLQLLKTIQNNTLFTPHSQQNFAKVTGYLEPHS
jgi:hypothetical protein